MIRGAMQEFRVPESEYDVIPFPISCPEYILQYAPKEAVYYMGLCDEWDEEKYKIFKKPWTGRRGSVEKDAGRKRRDRLLDQKLHRH